MDYKDFLSQIQNDINKRTQDVLGQSRKTVDSVLGRQEKSDFEEKNTPEKIDRLVKDSRLDSATQAKIGTFEQLYQGTYVADSKVPMYGYEDLDYASLVNLLASALEIELNMSLYQAVRKAAGVDIPKHAWKNTQRQEVFAGGQALNVGKATQMYGALQDLFAKFQDTVSSVVGNSDDFLKGISQIANTRNRASHTNMIDKDEFLSFYACFSGLFNRYIGRLLDLKESFRKSVTYGAFSYGNTARYDATDDDYIKGIKQSAVGERKGQAGVIFTDTRKLSYKYEGEINVVSGQKVLSLSRMVYQWLVDYAEKLKQHGLDYVVLDLGEGDYDYILNERNDWQAYLDILDDFCLKAGINGQSPQALFIIGGDDVVPMPQFHNPAYSPVQEANDVDVLEKTIDADFPYSFSSAAIKVTEKGELSLDALSKELMTPRFYVGRLPIESGFVKTSIKDDIESYLIRSLKSFAEGGMAISSPLLTSMRRTIQVSSYMTGGVPLVLNAELPDNMKSGKMVTSPALSIDDGRRKGIPENGVANYKSILSNTDMLIFLLHGGGHPASGAYSGDFIDSENHRIMPTAFVPELLPYGNFKSIATVSCYGAKYIGYSRDKSTLLSSIYRDTLCFMGSSRSALGDFDDSLHERGSDAVPKYSVRLMRYYLDMFFAGIPGGEAITKAKQQYISGITSWDYQDESIPYGMTTILEFNFYGDPMLWMQPVITLPGHADAYKTISYNDSIKDDKWSYDYEAVASPGAGNSGLLSRVRSLVDCNFESIHKAITDKLYKEFRLEPREFYSAHKYTNKAGDSGYKLQYRHNDGIFNFDTFVMVDDCGNILSVDNTY